MSIQKMIIVGLTLFLLCVELNATNMCSSQMTCGDGQCFQTTYPYFPYNRICQCRNGHLQFEPCVDSAKSTCLPNSCLNGALCVSYNSSNEWCNPSQIGKTCCVCPVGLTGLQCETNIDECSSSPCQNDASCIDLIGYYKCQCRDGYTGRNCEIKISKCNPNPCGNDKCIETTYFNGYVCLCPTGDIKPYRCDMETCLTMPCQNSGICVSDSNGEFNGCFCKNGFQGKYCQLPVPTTLDCSNFECQNGGICRNDNSSAYCECKLGFVGEKCEREYFKCNRNGRFKDSINCSSGKYFECVFYGQAQIGLPNGILFQRECPDNLIFNEHSDKCDFKENVSC